MDLGDLFGVCVGGLIGFLSACGLESLKRRWIRKDRACQLDRLIQLLYEEVEQLAELIDIDLGLVESEELDFVLGFGKGLEEFDGKLRATLARLQENRTIYSSQANHFLDLPAYLPNSLVRFYTRLQVNCGRMQIALDEGDLTRIRSFRSQSSIEAESLKADLKNAREGAKHIGF